MKFKFSHHVYNFSVDGVLAAIGVTPRDGVLYQELSVEAFTIIDAEVNTTARRLNEMLQDEYEKTMSVISEYSNFPKYIDTIKIALSKPIHTNVFWDGSIVQAQFIDTDALGDLGDLQRIQKSVYQGGTLEGWIGIYNEWWRGNSKKYEDIVGARLDIMIGEGTAPFWELLERGNGESAYPRNGPLNILLTFEPVYDNEMRLAFARVTSQLRSLVYKSTYFPGYESTMVQYKEKSYSGFSWNSQAGSDVFVISGSTKIDSFGRLTGKGFTLDKAGNVLGEWHGLLPH